MRCYFFVPMAMPINWSHNVCVKCEHETKKKLVEEAKETEKTSTKAKIKKNKCDKLFAIFLFGTLCS